MMYFDENIAYALAWTVVHALWQGLAVGLLVAVLFWVFRQSNPKFRYLIGMLGLLLILTGGITTFGTYYVPPSANDTQETIAVVLRATSPIPDTTQDATFVESFVTRHIYGIVWFWILGVCFFAIRLLGSHFYLHTLRKRSEILQGSELQQLVSNIGKRLHLRRKIGVATSSFVQSPMVTGWLKPLILFPVGLVNQLSMEELETILAHEIAHIHRHDYWANIFQSVVETLFFYHPVVWWISNKVRQERENTCDDIAVSLGGNKLLYAKTLLKLQEHAQTTPALALPLIGQKKLLLHRIQRILNHPQNKNSIMEKLSIVFLLAILLLGMSSGTETDARPEFSIESQICNNEATFVPSAVPPPNSRQDTIPKKKKREKIQVVESNRDISVEMENGEIKKLMIDGKVIPPESYHLYLDEIQKMKKSRHPMEVTEEEESVYPGEEPLKVIIDTDEGHTINADVYFGDGDRSIFVNDEGEFLLSADSIIVKNMPSPDDYLNIIEESNFEIDKLNFDSIQSEAMARFEIAKKSMDEAFLRLEEQKIELNLRNRRDLERAKRDLERAERDLLRANRGMKEASVSLSRCHPSTWIGYLIAEGYIKDAKKYKVRLSKKALIINGKKQPKEVLKKCLEMYEDQNGFPLSRESRIVIKKQK